MKSFEHGYLYDTPVSHALLRTMRALGEYRGRQALYTRQFPEILETLRRRRRGAERGIVQSD